MEFWELTPKEFSLVIEAYQERVKYNYENSVTMAYMTALWTNQWQTKNQPQSLDKILGKKEQKPMEANDILGEIMKINASLGGEVE